VVIVLISGLVEEVVEVQDSMEANPLLLLIQLNPRLLPLDQKVGNLDFGVD